MMERKATFCITTLFFMLISIGISVAETPSKPLRSKSLDFEDAVVEGLNKNPKDSLENLAKKDSRNPNPLYRKRLEFRKELKESAKEMGVSP